MREQRRETIFLARSSARCPRHERDQFSVKPRFAHQQARRHWHAHPPVFQHVNGEAGASRSQVAINVQVIIHAGQRRVGRRRFWIVLDRVSLRPQHAVLVDRNHHPPRVVGGLDGLLFSNSNSRASGSRRSSPTDGSGHDAGEERSQNESSELRKDGKNRIFHLQPRSGSAKIWFEPKCVQASLQLLGGCASLAGGCFGGSAMQSKNAGPRKNCSQFSVMITGGAVLEARRAGTSACMASRGYSRTVLSRTILVIPSKVAATATLVIPSKARDLGFCCLRHNRPRKQPRSLASGRHFA